MGLENGLIPTSDILVSSQKNPQATIDAVRIGNAKAWLAARNDSAPWIEIRFSQRKNVLFLFNPKNNPFVFRNCKNFNRF